VLPAYARGAWNLELFSCFSIFSLGVRWRLASTGPSDSSLEERSFASKTLPYPVSGGEKDFFERASASQGQGSLPPDCRGIVAYG